MQGKTFSQHEIKIEDLERIATPLIAMGEIYATEGNVHHFSRQLSTLAAPFFVMDNRFQLSPKTINFQTTCQEISALASVQNKSLIMATLKTIESSKGNEAETSLNPKDLLCKVWSLAKLQPEDTNACALVLDNLVHNRKAGGSCLAGIVTRLLHPFSFLVHETLQQRFLEKYQSPETHLFSSIPLSEENELRNALALSKAEAEKTATSLEDEQAFAAILFQLSLEESRLENERAVHEERDREFAKKLQEQELKARLALEEKDRAFAVALSKQNTPFTRVRRQR